MRRESKKKKKNDISDAGIRTLIDGGLSPFPS